MASPTPRRHRRRRLWLFRLAAATLVPALLLFAAEAVLRLAGYGHPTAFLIPDPDGAKDTLVGNEQFAHRFFPPHLARSPRPLRLTAEKPGPETRRVFVLGGSAAMGDPDPSVGLPRMLQAVLEGAAPGVDWQVVNASMTAINSHVVREIAADCAKLDADAFVLYLGNNEVAGPFGANAVFGDATPDLATVRANLAVGSTRLGQFVQNLARPDNPGTPQEWRGMAMFLDQQVLPGDPALEKVRDNFAANLGATVATARRHGTAAVLCTVASNLRGCPPFASVGNPDTATNAQAAFDEGERLLAAGDTTAALDAFTRARDHDTLRFRTSSALNRTIADVAASTATPLVDFVAIANQNSPDGIAGDELFYEHVHLTPAGNHLLARSVAAPLLESLDLPVPEQWPDLDACLTCLGHTTAHQIDTLQSLRARLSSPPFDGQSNHAARDVALGDQIAILRSTLNPGTLRDALAALTATVEAHPEDWLLRRQFALFLETANRTGEAVTQWRAAAERMPHYSVLTQLGVALNRDRQWPAAESALRRALRLRPDLPKTHDSLGIALSQQRRFAEAQDAFETATSLDPHFVTAYTHWAMLLENQNRRDQAAAVLRSAIIDNPDAAQLHYRLGKLLTSRSKFADARPHYQRAADLEPNNPAAHLNLAGLLLHLGEKSAAATTFEKVLELDPANETAQRHLDALRSP